MTVFPDALYMNGGVPVSPGSITAGNSFFVDPTQGSDDNDGAAIDRAKATLLAGYNLMTANQNDILYYIAGSSSLTLSAAFTWAKSYTHLMGICAPTHAAQRARIFQLSTLENASPLFNITATGCRFTNFYIFQGVDDTGSLINVQVTGGRNYFENVHFAGGGHATMAIDGATSLKLNGAEENTFKNCTFGVDTISAATGVAAMSFDAEAHRNFFEDCNFTLYAGDAGVMFVEVIDAQGFDRYNIFRRCIFSNTSSTSMDTAFEIPAGVGAPRTFYLFDSVLHGADDWEDGDRGVVFLNTGTLTAGGNAGIMQATNST